MSSALPLFVCATVALIACQGADPFEVSPENPCSATGSCVVSDTAARSRKWDSGSEGGGAGDVGGGGDAGRLDGGGGAGDVGGGGDAGRFDGSGVADAGGGVDVGVTLDAGVDAGVAVDAGRDAGGTLDAGPLLENAVDPLPQPPNGQSLSADDKASSPLLVRDLNQAGSGDLFGLFMAGSAYYLIVSTDDGVSWKYLPPSSGSPPASGMTLPSTAIAQDTVTYRLHYVTYPGSGSRSLYHRAALAYANGHVSGWSWEAADQPGPAFDASRGVEQAPRMALREIIDGSAAHLLALVGVDQPTDTEPRRLVAARTLAGPKALSPGAASDWGKVTDGSPGFSVLAAWNTGTGTDPQALKNFTQADPGVKEHNSTIALAQLVADGSLHLFTGTMYFNDTDAHGDITRWRLTRNGSSWSFDSSTSGSYVAPVSAIVRPCLGNAVATANFVWVTWGDSRGLHVGRIDASGGWTADALPSPDATSNVWWYAALNVAADETRAWLMWERNYGNHQVDAAGAWSGNGWTKRDDSSLWSRNASWVGGASMWTPIGNRTDGVGVMAYGYADWGLSPLHFSIHVVP